MCFLFSPPDPAFFVLSFYGNFLTNPTNWCRALPIEWLNKPYRTLLILLRWCFTDLFNVTLKPFQSVADMHITPSPCSQSVYKGTDAYTVQFFFENSTCIVYVTWYFSIGQIQTVCIFTFFPEFTAVCPLGSVWLELL